MTRTRKIALALVGTTVAALLPAAGALAAQRFSDVPPTYGFYRQIESMASAGITTGYADGTYRPGDPVLREQMAAFLNRGLGREAAATGEGDALVVPADPQFDSSRFLVAEAASTSITAGATRGGNGFVRVTGQYTVATGTPGACPCRVFAALFTDGEQYSGSYVDIQQLPASAAEDGSSTVSGSVSMTVPLAADATDTYRLVVFITDDTLPAASVSGHISASYSPYSGDGDATQEDPSGGYYTPPTAGLQVQTGTAELTRLQRARAAFLAAGGR